jgi:3-phenylpropionate/trans-cinnamate dioxygenase ferredoxin subunit
MKQINVAGRRLLLAYVDGNFYAIDDTCSHEDASLSRGSLKGELLKCPLHGSRFNVRTGEVMEDPAEENLRTYAVRVEGSSILIQVEKLQ